MVFMQRVCLFGEFECGFCFLLEFRLVLVSMYFLRGEFEVT